MQDLYEYVNPRNGKKAPLLSEETWAVVCKHKERINSRVIFDRDFNFNFFGFKTLERSYLLKLNGQIAERPQHMYMRVAIGIHGEDIEGALETYDQMSEGWFTHASPTLFNSGTPNNQLSSCFLLTMKDDSIEGAALPHSLFPTLDLARPAMPRYVPPHAQCRAHCLAASVC